MKDYIYVDYDFIQSYLAQAGKGLSQSTLYSNSTMKQETERTGNTEHIASSGGEFKGKSSHEISLKLYKSNFGGDTSFNVDLNNLIYLFEVWKSQSQITEEAISIELHDYAIELFENSFISEDSNKQRFKKSANLEFIQLSSNYKNDVSPITNLLESDFMIENDIPNYSKLTSSQKKEQKREHLKKKREEMNVDQSNLILAALTSIFPSQVSVSFVERNNFYLGTLKEENMRMNISEILFLYGNKTNLTIIGIFSRELTSVHSQYSELNMYSQLRVDFVSIINDFYKDSLNSVVIFKPILIYRSV